VDGRRFAMRDGVADDGVTIHEVGALNKTPF